jgi:hypothetical protein
LKREGRHRPHFPVRGLDAAVLLKPGIAKTSAFAPQQACLVAAFRKYFHLVSGMQNGEITACPSKP